MKMLYIDGGACIKCLYCVKVCPQSVFAVNGKSSPGAEAPERCIACGQCVAVCPADAVVHAAFPAAKVHRAEASMRPSPEQLMELIRTRRSNRAMTGGEVPEGHLQMILEAAHRAPTAENSQQIEFTLITGKENLRKISSLTIATFSRVRALLANPVVKSLLQPFMRDTFKLVPFFDKLKREFLQGNDGILRNASAVIIISAGRRDRFACEDANLAYQNASLMAEALGVAHFYTGFVLAAERITRKLNREFGISGRICAAMALGMPAVKFGKYVDRKEMKVTYRR